MKKIFFVAILLTFFVHKIYAAAHQTIPIYHKEKVNHELSSEDKFGFAMPETILDAVIKNDKKVLEEIIESEKQNNNFEDVINDTTIQTDLNGSSDFTPLMIAAANGNSIIAKILFEAGANPFLVNSNNQTFYDIAKDKPEFKEILEKYPDTQFKRLLAGIKFKRFSIKDSTFDLQKNELYPEYFGFDMKRYLLNPTIRKLIDTVIYGQRYKVKEIIEKIPQKELDDMRFTYNENGQTKKITLQMLAAIEDKPDILFYLLQEKNLDPSQKDSSGKTLFDYAFEKDIKGNFLRPHVAKALNEHRQELVDTMIKLKGLPRAVAEHLIGFLIPPASKRVPTTDPTASPAVPDDEQQ